MEDDDKKDFLIIEEKDKTAKVLSDIKGDIVESKLIAIDCEGVNLSRDGELTILSLATEKQVYIFDVLKLGKSVFDDGLREMLEDKSVEKLMFDCRQDSDSLWHQFNVKLTGVLDLQLLEIMYRRDEASSTTPPKYGRRSKNVDDVENVYGYKKCMELYVKDEEMVKGKKTGIELMSFSNFVWKRRPLQKDLIKYCCIDVNGLFMLYKSLKQNDRYLDRLRVSSERYADRYRCLTERKEDPYECNAYLPLDIIPEKGTLSFPMATTRCVECTRLFPHEEFSGIQLRNGVQKCRVCKKVKLRLDVQQNREDNWGQEYDECDSYVSDDDYYCSF